MPFSSSLFIHVFLPLFFLAYWATPKAQKNWTAIVFSLGFYAWGAPRFLPVVLTLGIVDYYVSHAIARAVAAERVRVAKVLLGLGVTVHLSMLAYFKYSNFFVAQANAVLPSLGVHELKWVEVVLPIGISFITFEEISYLVDVYRRDAHPSRRLSHYVLFLTFFPHSIAGPIFRWKDLERQLAERSQSWSLAREGFERFSLGLAKKVLVADSVAIIADGVFGLPLAQLSSAWAWLGAIAYTLQIYFDFSGYSDMAIGLGKLAGFQFKENFNQPYIASSIGEFWQRWHISLSSWLRDYLYIPLGGNRAGRARATVNIVLVFTISGLWHGAAWTFVVWGLFHGVLVAVERLLSRFTFRPPRFLQHTLTLVLVVVGWVFFRAASLSHAFAMLRSMFGAPATEALHPFFGELCPRFAMAALALGGLITCLPILWKGRPLGESSSRRLGMLRTIASPLLFALSAMHLTNARVTPLIYFKF
ncbi:MAG: MBOAT family protein [Polyangiaceae bacterium]|nr:MBOAT family protein [Polyangiaceae bacterium]